MFKRRRKRSYLQIASDTFYPPGGWLRALWYMLHRLRRLPDPPHRIARGVAVGIFVCFTPFYGFHFLLAIMLSWAMRGNVLASLIATFFGNPLTFPLIATVSVELGSWMLGHPGGMPLHRIVAAFSQASLELWRNLGAIFTAAPVHWAQMGVLFQDVFLPYLVGGLVPGIICGAIGYVLTHPVITTYQKTRIKRLKKRVEKRRKAAAKIAAKVLASVEAEADTGETLN